MSRRGRSSKIGVNTAGGRPSSSSGALRGSHREELTMLPEMPSFFPDPIALDADDCHLRQFRNELFQREYATSMRVVLQDLQAQLQQREEKQKQLRCEDNEGGSNFLQHFGGNWKPHVDDEGVRGRPDIDETQVLSSHTLEKHVSEVHLTPSSSEAKSRRINMKEDRSPKKPTEIPAEEAEGTSLMLSILTTPGHEEKERHQQLESSPDLPVYLTEPFPVALFALAEEVGMQDMTAETREVVESIAEARKQLGLNAVFSMELPEREESVKQQTSTTGNEPTTSAAPFSRAISGATIPSPRFAFTFPLGDAFVLEAEQRLAAEMFCESICEDIVEIAAEMYLTRTFDAMAAAYTACSIWDEVHDSVVRSFIPHNPLELPLYEAGLVSAPAIMPEKTKRIKKSGPAGALLVDGKDNKGRAEITSLAGDSLPYCGMLPEWAASPSLLDADAIIFFHRRGTAASRPFSGDALTKTNAMMRQEQGLTFSRLLNASLKRTEKRPGKAGVVTSRFSTGKAFAVAERERGVTEEDGDSPGLPPTPIALDDYARYVLPKVAELRRQQSAEDKERGEEQEAAKGTGLRRRSSRYRSNARSKDSVIAISIAPRKEEGEGELQVATRGTKPSADGVSEVGRLKNVFNRGRRRRQQDVSPRDLSGRGETNSSMGAVTAGQVVEDDLTKALQQLPHGYFAASTMGSNGATSVRCPVPDSLVFIEGDRAATFSTAVKKKQQEAVSGGKNSSMSKASMHVCRDSEVTLNGNLWSDDDTAKFSVNIMKGGRMALGFQPKAFTAAAAAEANTNAELPQESQITDNQTSRSRGRYVILTRKQQKALEDRRRRQKEAAEQAAYESLFVRPPPPSPNTNTDGTVNKDSDARKGHSPELEHSVRIVAEPGVVVERLPSPEEEKNAKAKAAKKGKLRGRQNKLLQGFNSAADTDIVLSDGGEWIPPEGKYRWSGFDPAAEESHAVAGAALVRSEKGVAPKPASFKTASTRQRQDEEKRQQSQGEREGRNEAKMRGSVIAAKSPAQTAVKLMTRPVQRMPAVGSVPRRGKQEGQKKTETETVATGVEKTYKVKYAAPVEPHGAQNMLRRYNLPRLPRRSLSSDVMTHDVVSSLKTPLASELDKIRRLASILKNDSVNAEA
ncbi:hypothetical protein TRSC58_05270 [Trypanosoma rangeli SC58]|uniref:Uncharacterized protein n=1 Tax=Trypanosoma rangeli SC58 TaxID=429131 RepID=A0A061J191_TRYRA|nr:hypothetical protein TRSC58_05270 [Trypanosoma rangeli SC58]